MLNYRNPRLYASGVVAVGIALALAACGSSGSGSTSTSAPASTGSNSSAGGVTVKTAHGSRGTYLVGPSGRAVYLFMLDTSGKSNCSGACASVWPPLTAGTGSPGASGGAIAADLGTITRSDGTTQVTYKGHPLYYYSADSGAGTTTGEGVNSYGAKWWLVGSSGAAITKSSTAASSSGSSSSPGYGY